MLKRIIPFAALGVFSIVSFTACKNNKFKTTENGLEYKIVKDEEKGNKPVIGDIVSMHILTKIGDSVLMDSRTMNNNQPLEFPLQPAAFKGDVTEGVLMMTPGDSAVFRVSLDSLEKAGVQLLPWMKKGGKIDYQMVLVSIKSGEQMRKEMEAATSQQRQTDETILQNYFTQNNTKASKTASGLYYTIEKPGTGEQAQAGKTVTVNYTGKTLDGTTFDSNVDPQFQHQEPFSFVLGQGQVIPGWDEGLALLREGSKAKLYIPSSLAYGPNSPNPNIPANAILVFDVEVTDVK